jgi:ATP-dependent RNA helicase MSS116
MLIKKGLNQKLGRGFLVLVISPTRELAMQTVKEAKTLLTYHKMGVYCVMGGTSVNRDREVFSQSNVDILVATPGRLLDHLENTPAFKGRCRSLEFLVLDEADQLLEMGFRQDIEKILGYLPGNHMRQNLLFSATMPKQVIEVATIALRPSYKFIDAIQEDDDRRDTNEQVVQHHWVVPFEKQFNAIYTALVEHTQGPHKVIVFLPTARQAAYMGTLYRTLVAHNRGKIGDNKTHILDIHSRKTQSARTKTSEDFRNGENVIMFSSDVSARGMDYPDVTFVMQVGIPTDRQQYIHRVGRTARAGKDGEALLVLCDFEKSFLKELSDLPITPYQTKQDLTMPVDNQVMLKDLSKYDDANHAYVAWLGFYKSFTKKLGMSREQLIWNGTYYAKLMGLDPPPRIKQSLLAKMGLRGLL